MFPLVSLSFIVTFAACFVATSLYHDPSLYNVAAFSFGAGLMFAICRTTFEVSAFARGPLLNVRALRTRTVIALALLSVAVSVALYSIWGCPQ